jgi:hypothetical protein
MLSSIVCWCNDQSLHTTLFVAVEIGKKKKFFHTVPKPNKDQVRYQLYIVLC